MFFIFSDLYNIDRYKVNTNKHIKAIKKSHKQFNCLQSNDSRASKQFFGLNREKYPFLLQAIE